MNHKEPVDKTIQSVIAQYSHLNQDAVYKLALATSLLICRISKEYPNSDVFNKIDYAIEKDIESNPELEKSYIALKKGIDLILESENY